MALGVVKTKAFAALASTGWVGRTERLAAQRGAGTAGGRNHRHCVEFKEKGWVEF